MTTEELKERQSWSLTKKIDHSMGVIEQFHNELDGKVYVSFSGGKDSTIVLWLAQKLFPDIKAVFCNTGNEYPDIVKFVRAKKYAGGNIEIIYPDMKPKQVIAEYGFPLISKTNSQKIDLVRRNPNTTTAQQILGNLPPLGGYTSPIPQKYRYLLDAKFRVSALCCKHLKKMPMRAYEKRTGLKPIMGIMASESNRRSLDYIVRGGCNVFRKDGMTNSHPLSIWLEQDVWDCIEKYNIPISDIYRKGAQRTGCMFCGYGCQFKNDNRLKLLYELYPKAYRMFMNYTNNGVTYRDALRSVLEVNDLDLPDEILF